MMAKDDKALLTRVRHHLEELYGSPTPQGKHLIWDRVAQVGVKSFFAKYCELFLFLISLIQAGENR